MKSKMDFSRRTGSAYYDVLGVVSDSSSEEIRRAYRKPAMRWHPDKWARNPGLFGEAKHRFQQVHEAYSVLSDTSKRTLYAAVLYNPEEDDDEDEENISSKFFELRFKGFSDFVREMVSLMAEVKREEKAYSLEELQGMFTEMSNAVMALGGFESPKSDRYYDSSNHASSVFNSSSFSENNNLSVCTTLEERWSVASG